MCLGVPGKVVTVYSDALGIAMGKVSFGGIAKDVCLAYTPEAQAGQYVVVHAGFAISVVDEQEAMEVFKMLEQMDELAELDIAQPA
ncbi:MAG: HypC/HybG/HupF family hydrogenase formation chaperone [Anaerolineae bacterium]